MSTTGSCPFDRPSQLTVTSETANLAKVRAAVEDAARRIGFLEEQVSTIALAIDEAVTNVIRHGYEGQRGQPIDVTIEPVHRRQRVGLQVTICDCGRQVDPGTIVGRELEEVRPGGLGTHIIRTVMDELEYTHRDPAGMKLRLVKLIDAPPHHGGENDRSA